jgi:hypothetical protein
MNTENIKTLDAARAEIVSLRSQLGLPPLASAKQSKTLASAKVSIESLRKQLVAGKSTLPNAIEAKNLLTALPSLESIKAELENKSRVERIKSLASHAETYKAKAVKARSEKDYKAETQILRDLQRITNRHAQELFAAGPEAMKAFKRRVPNEL